MNSKKKKMLKRAIPLYIMVAPGFIYLLINNYIPMLGIVIAFKNLNFSKGILKSDWAGLSNFEYLFKAPDAFLITRNTILYNVAFIVVNTVVAIVIAIILSEIRSKMKVKMFQSCVLIPSLISIIIVSYLAYAFLSGRTGFINGSLAAAGKDTISFYTEPKYWPAILIFINCWKGAGYSSIIYLAAILGIDQEMYEAAKIDGATRPQQIWYITIPAIRGTVLVVFILNLAKVLNLFEPVWVLQNAMVMGVSDVIGTFVYRLGITGADYGLSTAAGLFKSVISVILVTVANRASKKINGEGIL